MEDLDRVWGVFRSLGGQGPPVQHGMQASVPKACSPGGPSILLFQRCLGYWAL
ncbi:TGFB1I1 isoform 2 [Pan troglodytes]|uniref:TGFB1I1 isoform 2 n=2 Tax=Hominidae TaxID=9604 RepID=A0A2J8TKV7_PONAB|nr:TGFB1I1 isoform 2 [Pan troglodytes]PNJ33680.1 TGFB1I1 isoform 2 [Pongo abelii]